MVRGMRDEAEGEGLREEAEGEPPASPLPAGPNTAYTYM